MAFWNRNKPTNELRVIKTARDLDSMNEAANKGFKPLIKKVKPSPEIRSKYLVVQHKKTGEVEVIGDMRLYLNSDIYKDFKIIIDWTYYYPYNFKSPFAAYLIPNDIAKGERVFVEDLIEDFVGASWNQGSNYRLESCEAIWNGKDLIIKYDPKKDSTHLIG